jgi:hypothetical protein
MIADEKHIEVKRMAEDLFAQGPDWTTFYREILGVKGIVRHVFPTPHARAEFERTETFGEILHLVTKLRRKRPVEAAPDEEDAAEAPPKASNEEPTRVITVRLPKSMHETLRAEAYEHRTSVNKLCISKLLQFIDADKVPTET